jgi:hypothetical protein
MMDAFLIRFNRFLPKRNTSTFLKLSSKEQKKLISAAAKASNDEQKRLLEEYIANGRKRTI